jgi:hypothetical protein
MKLFSMTNRDASPRAAYVSPAAVENYDEWHSEFLNHEPNSSSSVGYAGHAYQKTSSVSRQVYATSSSFMRTGSTNAPRFVSDKWTRWNRNQSNHIHFGHGAESSRLTTELRHGYGQSSSRLTTEIHYNEQSSRRGSMEHPEGFLQRTANMLQWAANNITESIVGHTGPQTTVPYEYFPKAEVPPPGLEDPSARSPQPIPARPSRTRQPAGPFKHKLDLSPSGKTKDQVEILGARFWEEFNAGEADPELQWSEELVEAARILKARVDDEDAHELLKKLVDGVIWHIHEAGSAS